MSAEQCQQQVNGQKDLHINFHAVILPPTKEKTIHKLLILGFHSG